MKRKFQTLTLIPCLLSGPALAAWALSTGQTMHYWILLVAPFLWLILLSLWYLVIGSGPFLKRLKFTGIIFGVLVLLGIAASKLLRYEGSTSGTSMPKLSWVWQKEITPPPPEALLDEAKIVHSGIPQAEINEAAENITQFLGDDRDGMWDSAAFSLDWKTNQPREVWRRPIGGGWSGFSVIDGKAITQEQIGESESITCLDLYSGKRIWTYQDEGLRFLNEKSAAMSGDGPRGTPTIHQGKVYTLGSTGIVNCCDLETGELIWKKNVLTEFEGEIPDWGKSTAPLIVESANAVVVTGAQKVGGTLFALDLETGDLVWRFKGKGGSYSSPRLIKLHGKRQLVSVNALDVTGHDPKSGALLWEYEWPGVFPKVGQPILVGEDKILVTASYGMSSHLIEISREGENWSTKQAWKTLRLKTKFSSAVIDKTHAYGLDEGRLACIDLADGRIVWKAEKYGFGQQLKIEDHLIIQTEEGDVAFGKISPEGYEEKARLEGLDSMTWNMPTLAGRLLLVRNDKEAICYLLPKK